MRQIRLKVLHVEDEESDVLIMQTAAEGCGAAHALHAVSDGEEATRYLRGEGQYADREKFPFPDVILTDLKMPRMDGFDFLRWRRADPACALIPTIVLSSSDDEADVREAYRLGANSYLMKPCGLASTIEMLRTTFDYWGTCQQPDCSGFQALGPSLAETRTPLQRPL